MLRWATVACIILCPLQALAWQSRLSGRSGYDDYGYGVGILPGGDIVAVGTTAGAESSDLTVVRLAAGTGGVVWRSDGRPTLPRRDEYGCCLAVTSSGDFVVAGSFEMATGKREFGIARVNANDGAIPWIYTISGTQSGFVFDFPRAISWAPSYSGIGNVAGEINNANTGRDFAVLKVFTATGQFGWRYEVSGPDTGRYEAALAVVAHPQFSIAAGTLGASTDANDFFVVKLNQLSGQEQWRTRVRNESSRIDRNGRGHAVVLDADSNPVVAGSAPTLASDEVFTVAKLALATGAPLWQYAMSDDLGGGASAVDVDAAGDVFAGGSMRESPAAGRVGIVVKLAGASGAELWRRTISGTVANGNNNGVGRLQVAPNGNVVIAAAVDAVGSSARLALELDGASGDVVWTRQLAPNGHVQGMAVDADGNVAVVGSVVNDGYDFAVTKLSAANGGDFPCGNGVANAGEQCDDADTDDADCCPATCLVPPNGSACEDRNFCTEGDACSGTTCVAGPQKSCATGDPCAPDGACTPATGACTPIPVADDTPCDDGSLCTQGETCLGGACMASTTTSCATGDACAPDGVCMPATGTCVPSTAPDGTACDDQVACTVLDACSTGTCGGTTLTLANIRTGWPQASVTPTCARQKVVRGVTKRFNRVLHLVERAQGAKKVQAATRRLEQALRLVRGASKMVDRAAAGTGPKAACTAAMAPAVREAAARIACLLPTDG